MVSEEQQLQKRHLVRPDSWARFLPLKSETSGSVQVRLLITGLSMDGMVHLLEAIGAQDPSTIVQNESCGKAIALKLF